MEADRSQAGGPNQSTEPGTGSPPSPDATTPPEPSPPGSGGTNRPAGGEAAPKAVRGRQPKSTPAAGRATTTEEADQAAFEQGLAGDDPGRFAR